MNFSWAQIQDLGESGFNPFTHIFLNKNHRRLIGSFGIAFSFNEQLNLLKFFVIIFQFIIGISAVCVKKTPFGQYNVHSFKSRHIMNTAGHKKIICGNKVAWIVNYKL